MSAPDTKASQKTSQKTSRKAKTARTSKTAKAKAPRKKVQGKKVQSKKTPRTAGSSLAQKLERIVEELEHLRTCNAALEKRVVELESGAAQRPAPAPPPASAPAAPASEADESAPPALANLDGELREDSFGPAVVRTSNSSHKNAVNKALSMLGLVPTADDGAERERASTSHKRALDKALSMMGKTPGQASEPESVPEVTDELVVEPEAGVADEPVVEPVAEEGVGVRWEAAERESDRSELDLETAVPVELERSGGLHGIAVAGLAVATIAAVIALSPMAATGAAAAVFGVLAFFWRTTSIHLRAALAGAATLLLHALALHAAPALPLAVFGVACLAASGAGALLAAWFRHPLVLFVGFLAAVATAPWVGAQTEPLAGSLFAFVTSAGAAYGALRLQRLQVAIAVLAVAALLVSSPWAAAAMAAVHLAVALAAIRMRRPGRAPAVLAVAALGLFAWTAHGLVVGAVVVQVALLVLPAMVAAFASATLPRGFDLFSAALRAGAVVLVVSILPLGFSGPVLGGVALLVSLLFGAFALALDDAYLRIVGTLVLVAAAGIVVALGAPAYFLAGVCLAALLLYAVPARQGVLIPLILGALAVTSGLAILAVVLPVSLVAGVWAAFALGLGLSARRWPLTILRAGAVVAIGAAATWTLLFTPTPVMLGLAAALVLPHVWMLGPIRRPREAGALLLLFELLLVATMQVIWPGPLGALAVLPLLAVLVGPWWGVMRHTLRPHARFLSFVLLVRCLFPDIRDAMATPLGLAAAASAAACVALSLWLGRTARPAATSPGATPAPPEPVPASGASPES